MHKVSSEYNCMQGSTFYRLILSQPDIIVTIIVRLSAHRNNISHLTHIRSHLITLKSIKSLSHLASRAHCYEISSTGELFSSSELLATEYLCSCCLNDVKRFSEFCQWKWKSIVLIEVKNVSSIGSTIVEKQSEVDGKGGWSTGCPHWFCMHIAGKDSEVLFNKLVLVFIHTSKLHPNYIH